MARSRRIAPPAKAPRSRQTLTPAMLCTLQAQVVALWEVNPGFVLALCHLVNYIAHRGGDVTLPTPRGVR